MKNKENWQDMSLGEISKKISPGGTPKRKVKEYWENGTIMWLKISDLKSGVISNSEEKITKKALMESATEIFPVDSVLISIIGTVGKIGILAHESCFSQSIIGIQPNTDLILPKYLYYFLKNSTDEIRGQTEKGTHENINTKALKKIRIRFGNLQSQKDIVGLLEKISNIQNKRNQSVSISNQLLQSSFIEFFGDPVELMNNSKMATLESISEIRSGITMNKHRREGDNKIPYLTVRNLYREYFDLSDLREISVSESDLKKWKLEYGDLCILEGGDREDVGRTAVFQNNPKLCVHQNHIFRIRLNKKKFNPFFVSTFLNSDYMQEIFFNETKATSGISSINKTQLSRIKIPIVEIEKQNQFEKIYLKINNLKNMYNNDTSIVELMPSLSTILFS